MENPAQHSDSLTLEETLAAMKRIGVAPEGYRDGYQAGFLGLPFHPDRGIAYARGRAAGLDAFSRGAHSEAREARETRGGAA